LLTKCLSVSESWEVLAVQEEEVKALALAIRDPKNGLGVRPFAGRTLCQSLMKFLRSDQEEAGTIYALLSPISSLFSLLSSLFSLSCYSWLSGYAESKAQMLVDWGSIQQDTVQTPNPKFQENNFYNFPVPIFLSVVLTSCIEQDKDYSK
jgi:hypothetical protein